MTISPSLAVAEIVTMFTTSHPLDSGGRIEFYVGEAGAGGILLYTLENVVLEGTALVDVNLDPNGDGSFQLLSMSLAVSDVPTRFVDLGQLGTAEISSSGLIMNVYSGVVPVSESRFTLDYTDPGSLDLVDGVLSISNTTGFAALVFPEGASIDLSVRAVRTPFSSLLDFIPGTVDEGAGFFAQAAEFNLGDPQLIIDLDFYAPLFMRFIMDVHLAAVPEAQSIVLTAMAVLLGILGQAPRLRDKKSRS